MRPLIALLFLNLLATGAVAQPRQWRDPDLGARIVEGVASADHIWLRGSTRKVLRLSRSTGERTVVADDVEDMIAMGERLWVLTGPAVGGQFTLIDLRSEDATSSAQDREHRIYLHSGRDSEGEVVGLFALPGASRPAVLTTRAVAVPDEGGWKRHRLAADLHPGAWISAPTDDVIYVGYNRGEWGGGLRRVDLPSGSVSFVTEAGDDACGGLLPPACAPIVGAFGHPSAPGCVLIGSGIAHLRSSRGSVFRVCGSEISTVYSTPTPPTKDKWMFSEQPWPLHGFAETDDGWIGISRDRYFRNRNGDVTEHAMPTFQDRSGIQISAEQENVLFVVSSCCWGTEAGKLYSTIAIPVRP